MLLRVTIQLPFHRGISFSQKSLRLYELFKLACATRFKAGGLELKPLVEMERESLPIYLLASSPPVHQSVLAKTDSSTVQLTFALCSITLNATKINARAAILGGGHLLRVCLTASSNSLSVFNL